MLLISHIPTFKKTILIESVIIIFMDLLILCFLAVSLCTAALEPSGNSVAGPGFPKILWTYWDSDLESAPIMTQICINNMRHYAEISGWEFRFVTLSNLTDFLTEESQEKMKRITDQFEEHNIGVQQTVDIYRIFLLYDNGGMWVDATTLFVRDFGWVEEIADYKLAYNKVSEVPEMIVFTSNEYYSNSRTHFDERIQQNVTFFPGTEIWAFVTQPRSRFHTDLISNILYTLTFDTFSKYA
jgi:hypothetical protein